MNVRDLISVLLNYDMDAEIFFEVPKDIEPAPEEDDIFEVNDVFEMPPMSSDDEPMIIISSKIPEHINEDFNLN